jgi:hypothetical protein
LVRWFDWSAKPNYRHLVRDEGVACCLSRCKGAGVKLGGPKLKAARKIALASIKANADRRAANVVPIIREIQKSGASTLRGLADALSARGIQTPRGGKMVCSLSSQCIDAGCGQLMFACNDGRAMKMLERSVMLMSVSAKVRIFAAQNHQLYIQHERGQI